MFLSEGTLNTAHVHTRTGTKVHEGNRRMGDSLYTQPLYRCTLTTGMRRKIKWGRESKGSDDHIVRVSHIERWLYSMSATLIVHIGIALGKSKELLEQDRGGFCGELYFRSAAQERGKASTHISLICKRSNSTRLKTNPAHRIVDVARVGP